MQSSGVQTPLYYASGSQVNFQVPWELAGKSQASISVTVGNQTSNAQTVNLASFAPGIFSMNAQGTGQGAIADNSTGQLVDVSHSAIPGTTILQIYATGLGPVTNQPPTGGAAPNSPLAATTATPTVTIGGLSAPVLFSGLAPGSVGEYVVDAQVPNGVSPGNAVPVVVTIGGVTSNTVTMAVQAVANGNIQLQITGLPSGVPASVTISSPAGFTASITTNQTLQVPPGVYSIVANSIVVGAVSYGAFPTQQSAMVSPGANVSVTVPYNVIIPQSTKVLDSQALQGLTASADGSTISLPAASQVAQTLAPGHVLAIGITPSTPNGLLRKIMSVSQVGSQIVVTTVQATLADAFQQVNFSFSTAIVPQSAHNLQALRSGVSIRRVSRQQMDKSATAGQVQLSCPSEATLVEMQQTPIAQNQFGSITATGSIQICPTLEFDWNLTAFPPTLNSLTATVTYGAQGHVQIAGRYDNSFDSKAVIATVTSDPIPVDVAGVPIVLTPSLTFYVGANGQLNAGFSVGVTETASVTGGVSYANGQISPVFTKSTSFSQDPVGIDAQLTAKAYVGLTVDLNVDGVLSPEFSPDTYLQLNVDPLINPWWNLSGGIEGSASVKVGIFGVNLKDFEYPNLFDFSLPIAQADGNFSTVAAAPTLSTVTPVSALVRSGDLTLTVTGANFVPGAIVSFNGQPLTTIFVDPTQLTAILTASNLVLAGPYPVTVTNPDTSGAVSTSTTFVVQPQVSTIAIQSLNLSPTSVTGGNPSTGTVTLSGSAPSGGVQVNLSSNNSNVTVLSSVTIGSGQSSGTFSITTSAVSSTQTAQITAYLGTSSKTTVLTVSSGNSNPSGITEYPVPTSASGPFGIASAADGALWFTEIAANRIGRITTAGSVTEYLVPPPSGQPTWIAAGPDGALWFTENIGSKVGRITTGGVITEYAVPTDTSGIAAGPDGALWFTDNNNNIGRITTAGAVTEYSLPTLTAGPWRIASGPDGALWFTEQIGNNIGRITTGGVVTEFPVPTLSSYPNGITAGPDGALWFTETLGNNVGRITTGGVITEYLVPTSSSGPEAIAVGPDGALWFTESFSVKIGRITTAGVVTEYSGPMASNGPLDGITAGPDGAVWFTESNGNKIGRVGLTTTATPNIQNLSLSSASISGGISVTGTVTLSTPAPLGGVQVNLSSNSSSVQVPSSVSIGAGQNSASFAIATVAVTSVQAVTITAQLGGSSAVVTLTVSPVGQGVGGSGLLAGKAFSISGTLIINGSSLAISIQGGPDSSSSYSVVLESLSSYPVAVSLAYDGSSPTFSGNNVVFSGPALGLYLDESNPFQLNTVNISSATLSLTFSAASSGATISGTLSFPGSNGTMQGTISGTVTSIQ